MRPVFLLVPLLNKYKGGWLENGQINGLVYGQKTSFIISGIHYKKIPKEYSGIQFETNRLLTKEYHKYAIEWKPQIINWYFDDVLYFSENVSQPFDQPFRIVLQLGVGGPEFNNQKLRDDDHKNWKNNKFIIDYVRVYKNASEIDENLSNCQTIALSEKNFMIFNLIIVFGIKFLLSYH